MDSPVHPDHWSNGPRVGARGIVVHAGRILLLQYTRDGDTAYLFPGGGHDSGETLADNVRREVYEETGLSVDVGRLLLVHEHQPSKGIEIPMDIRSIYVGDAHRVDFFFECAVIGDAVPNMEIAPDNLHIGFIWAAPDELGGVRLIPDIAPLIQESLERGGDLLFSES